MVKRLEGSGPDALYSVVGEVEFLQLVEAGQRPLPQAPQTVEAEVQKPVHRSGGWGGGG